MSPINQWITDRLSLIIGGMFLIMGTLVLLSVVVFPYVPDSVLFSSFGFIAYVLPVFLIGYGLALVQTIKPVSFLKMLVRFALNLVSILWICSSIELLSFFARPNDIIWILGGVAGSVPYRIFGFISNAPLRILLSILLSTSVAMATFQKPIIQLIKHIQKQVKTQHPTKKARIRPVKAMKPIRAKPVPSKMETPSIPLDMGVAPKQYKPGKKQQKPTPDEPIPLSILPDPTEETVLSQKRDLLTAEVLDGIEDIIVEVALARIKLKLARVVDIPPRVGVHVIQFTFKLDNSSIVLVNRLISIVDDLGIALQRAPVQIHIKENIVIDVPLMADERQYVPIKPLLQEALGEQDIGITYLVGRDTEGLLYQLSVRKCIHMLVGGQTQSGKSVLLHSIIFGFIFRYKPSQVRIALYDHKMEEFTCYAKLPHLWGFIATNLIQFDQLLESLEQELLQRKMQRVENRRVEFPLLVIIMDEFRGLNTDRLVTLISECRSLHMVFILATQYPRADIISTPIKANLVTNLCFKTRDPQASRLVIGEPGAERLMGNGDCLVHSPLSLDRVQVALSTRDDIEALEHFLEGSNGANARSIQEAAIKKLRN